jgi:hypothetical protein
LWQVRKFAGQEIGRETYFAARNHLRGQSVAASGGLNSIVTTQPAQINTTLWFMPLRLCAAPDVTVRRSS